MYKLCLSIDKLNELIGKVSSWAIMLLAIVVVFEVIMRYFFNSPTIYSFELTLMIYGFHFMIPAAYTLLHDSHVSIDIVHNLFSKKNKLIIDIIGYIVFFFPFTGILLYQGTKFSAMSWVQLERSGSVWRPPLYYIKTVLPLTMLLLLLQGISIFYKKYRNFKEEK
ncbi:MAG: TRAP transporter small permease subunit [Desulfobacteraceae bacterium]|nr:TRAP transporter small permease subunit [Desulfobacteraceae bacterium]MBC2749966.1 TRAP transporter small permease subunit [Desulfobacteraceae bacterium]